MKDIDRAVEEAKAAVMPFECWERWRLGKRTLRKGTGSAGWRGWAVQFRWNGRVAELSQGNLTEWVETAIKAE